MKSAKHQSGKSEQAPLMGSIKKSIICKKTPKSLGSLSKKMTVHVSPGKGDSTQFGFPPKQGDCNSDKSSKQGNVCKLPSDINAGETKMHQSSKIKLQLFPLDERIRMGLEKDGRNPFLELTLSARKKISSILSHLFNKWGSSSIATGELMLFSFDAEMENLTEYQSWSSRDFGFTAGDVHSAIGSPEIFRLRYGWIRPDLDNDGCTIMGPASRAENQAKMKTKELGLCSTSGLTDDSVKLTSFLKSLNTVAQPDQAVVNSEALKPSLNEIKNDTAADKHSSAELVRQEEAYVRREHSQPSVFWSDLSNMSIGGLLSEASLLGRFNSPSIPDSMDALVNQVKVSNTSTNIDMPSSILDAEETCHSFGLSKPSPAKDFLSIGGSAFSGLSGLDTASRPSRFSKSQANVQNDSNGDNESQKRNPAELFNNENSLGLSSIRWNDSLGPFDLPMMPRQIIKDDSISIGGFFR